MSANLRPVEDLPTRLLKPAEAAEMLGLSVKALANRRRAREIPYVLIGRLVRFDLRDLEAYIDSRRRGGPRRQP
jgi:excisionase family DNA binding protein